MPSKPSDVPSDAAPAAAGRRRRLGNRPVFFLMGIVVAAVFTVGWGIALVSYNGGLGSTSYQVVAWRVLSDSEATISFQVNTRDPALCLVSASDARHVQVGQTEVPVEAGVQDVHARIETVREASTVEVTSCREQGSQNDPAQ
ncbi:DUF4307 domain-containing protein [Marinitenerispora sediminis]|uniref:DUF4307 domain-containing protein n=1 Tax=Marinitenerispora sediminis TaxID=1931232 RepID=A0A368TBB9_9ACTN|nr:DUF4307 domain-containing protein [Marinitenerispora sediminis]RCV54403.1 DUF4307 domain-containing protein [Marinitenerispora sediminis]RCV61132.1 DUF4307 domain-containing protein [Marinitenerispora sediminis]RCV62408.1 DUF4307 domain-containing protein [Marinitenerispora sediminis]